MPPNRYQYGFASKNDEDERFILSFEVLPGKILHVVCEAKVYQRRGDMYCKVTSHVADKRTCLHVESIHNSMQFGIEIFVHPKGCEIFVIEKVLTTIAHIEVLKPTSIADHV